MDTKTKYFTVYNMKYAMELKHKGHKVVETLPNPKKPSFMCWVFEVDETFHLDFAHIKGGARIGR